MNRSTFTKPQLSTTTTIFLLFLKTSLVFGNVVSDPNNKNIIIINNTNNNNKEPKCVDGKLPLLDENRTLFPCQRGCPDTFFCEAQASMCCPNSTAIELSLLTISETRDQRAIGFQLESSAELEKSMSCERFPYKATCEDNNENGTDSQPQAKWYFDLQTLSCEMYPLGMCENEDPLEKLALRTREECEQRCDVAKVRSALEKLPEANSIEHQPTAYHRLPHVPQIAIDDVVQESKHIRGRPFAVEPPTDLFHVIHVPSDAHIIQKRRKTQKEREEIEENQLLTTDSSDENAETVPTVTSDILTVLEDVHDDSDAQEGSGSTSSKFSESSEVEDDDENENVITIEKHQRKKSLKSMEDSFERFYQRNREAVSCSQTAYRLICTSGAPSQFVYRWEKVNGVCQSFPYGYCWHEKNVPHPRTRAECEQFCD